MRPTVSQRGIREFGTGGLRSDMERLRVALVIPDLSMDVDDIGVGLRAFFFLPVVLLRIESLDESTVRWKPAVAVVGGGLRKLRPVLRTLAANCIPTILIGTGPQLRAALPVPGIAVGIPAPVDGREVASAAAVLATGAESQTGDAAILGRLQLDATQRLATIDGRRVELPPREFSILAELALHPNTPISAADLARRAFEHQSGLTPEDVRRCVYRLRRMIGDVIRDDPLIRTRHGFG